MKSAVFFGCLIAMSMPLSAATQREKSCEITTQIVTIAVKDRLEGRSPDAIKAALAKEGSGITGVYLATIEPLVDMVFALDRNGLSEQAAEDYRTQCLGF